MGIYRRGRIWYIDYYFEGKRIREAVGGNRRQAERALVSRKGEIAQGRFRLEEVRPTPYFTDFARDYLKWAEANHRSYRTMDIHQVRILVGWFKGKRLHEITPFLIERYKQERRGKVSPSTVNRGLAVLSSMLSRAVEWGYLREHPMKGGKVRKLREESRMERILSPEEEARLISSCSGWFRDMVVLALDTGMRLSELVRLSWEDVDLGHGVVKVRNTKSGRDRKVLLTERAVSALRRRRMAGGGSTWVFPPGTGDPMWRVRSAFIRACRRAGIVGLRFHDLRHTCASRLVAGGIDLATVQGILGHQDIRMTLRYSHPGSAEMRRAVKVLEEMARYGHKMDTEAKQGLEAILLTP